MSNVEHPEHYNRVEGIPEVWDILDAFFPDNPTLWNAGKYLLRCDSKGKKYEDLGKLIQYAERERAKIRCRDNPDTADCEKYLWGYDRREPHGGDA